MLAKLLSAFKLDTLKPRERIVLAIGAVTIPLSLLWFLVIQPLDHRVRYLTQQVSHQQAELQWMQRAAEAITRLRENAGTDAPGSESLLMIVDDNAKKVGISRALKRIEPIGQEGVRVWLEDVAFQDLLRWLGNLRVRGVRADSIAIERRKTPGLVHAKATLKGG
uniref:Type II secretion system protein M n=1 Tax=Candidatus Kentrum sp. MB TaxID=2138164 RepID=A0A450WYH9_9GAMM|nr:MAG: general secretion pathway protein M [Candidatus Kentron sp. MB]VFK27682.1 MAG: general secretion pathway protein M [Candidatus Kentron sp. MB]VFK74387.1 MAG: general secretion pathway protein M [Candidatus Kentron sp. MB]